MAFNFCESGINRKNSGRIGTINDMLVLEEDRWDWWWEEVEDDKGNWHLMLRLGNGKAGN
jgi:hypothetical protein